MSDCSFSDTISHMAYISAILTAGLVLFGVAYTFLGYNVRFLNKVTEMRTAKKTTENMKDESQLRGQRFYVHRDRRDVRVNLYRMHEDLPLMFFAHGGHFIDEDADLYDELCAEMAEELHCAVVSINYSKIGAHASTYPQQEIRDVILYFCTHEKEFGIRAQHPVMAGMEAGAYLILQAGIHAVQSGIIASGYILIDPFIDYVCVSLAKARQHPSPSVLLFSGSENLDAKEEYLRALEENGIDTEVLNVILHDRILMNTEENPEVQSVREQTVEWLKEAAGPLFSAAKIR